MLRPEWKPIPYYYASPLAKLQAVATVTKLPHKLGYIPKYLREKRVQ